MELLPASVIAKNYAPKDFLKESFQLVSVALPHFYFWFA